MIPQLDAAKFASKAAVWLLALVIFLGYSGVLVWSGWTIKSNAVDAKELKTVTVQLDQVKAQAQADIQEYFWRLDIDAKVRSDKAAKAATDQVTFKQIREEIPHVAKPIPAAAPPPDCPVCSCRYGADFVRVWNRSLGAGADAVMPGAAAGPAAAVAGADPAAAASGSVDAADLLTNHADNAEVTKANRRNCQAVLDWHALHQQGPTP